MNASTAEMTATETREADVFAPHRALMENAMFGVGVFTEDGRWRAANPSLVRILGCESETEVLALEPDAYFACIDDVGRIRRAREGGRLAQGVISRWRTHDGREVVVRMSGHAAPLGRPGPWNATSGGKGGDGAEGRSLYPVEVLVEDITERRQLEEQLRQAQKMETIGAMSGGIAHDFNNILTIVLSNADLIAEALPPDSFHLRADLDELQRAARRGADLIAKLLSFARRQDLQPETVELGELVRDASIMIRRLLPAPVSFDLEIDRRAKYFVHADVTAIQQILLNLVTNARDAMPDGGRLQVRLQQIAPASAGADGRIRLSVSDTGCGMDSASLERAFEPFFTTKESGRGTGLGLPMVQALATQLGGTAAIDSTPARGTTVRVELPAVAEPDRDEPPVAAAATTSAGAGCVLVAEDDEVIRRAIKRVLERYEYTIVSTADGQEALEWLDSHPNEVDLVLTDLVMPRLSGLDLYREIRDRGNPPRFLFTSGYLDPAVRAEVDASPDLVFLPKPWTVAELVASVRAITEPSSPSRAP